MRNRSLRALSTLGVALSALMIADPGQAVSNRIFMSTNGDNASDCANPLTPCLTFAGALAQVNPGGEIIAEATGGYGALNITQAVTISGPPGVVIYSGLSVSVNAPGATVVLRGLTIDGTGASGNGINVVAVGTLSVESCVITGFTGQDTGHGSGIYFGSGGALFVRDTLISGNSDVGIWIDPLSGTAIASIERSRLENNIFGLISDSGAITTVRDSVCTTSSGSAFGFAAQSGGELNLENCNAFNSGTGIFVSAGSTVRVSNSTVTHNMLGLSDASGSLLSRGNNTVEGNTTNGSFTGTYSAK